MRTDEPGSSIAKDLIDSEDPKHTLFCRETAFLAIYALFQELYSHRLIEFQIYLPYLWKRKAMDKTEKLSKEQKSYR